MAAIRLLCFFSFTRFFSSLFIFFNSSTSATPSELPFCTASPPTIAPSCSAADEEFCPSDVPSTVATPGTISSLLMYLSSHLKWSHGSRSCKTNPKSDENPKLTAIKKLGEGKRVSNLPRLWQAITCHKLAPGVAVLVGHGDSPLQGRRPWAIWAPSQGHWTEARPSGLWGGSGARRHQHRGAESEQTRRRRRWREEGSGQRSATVGGRARAWEQRLFKTVGNNVDVDKYWPQWWVPEVPRSGSPRQLQQPRQSSAAPLVRVNGHPMTRPHPQL